MIEEIEKIYNELNSIYVGDCLMNDKELRFRIISDICVRLEKSSEKIEFIIYCDEENNPPEVIDNQCAIATIVWHDIIKHRTTSESSHIKLIFGRPEQVKKLEHLRFYNM